MDNLLQTLRFLEKWQSDVVAESQLIIACQDSMDEVPNNFKEYKQLNFNLGCMSISRITNFAIQEASCDKVVLMDGDRVPPPEYLGRTLDAAEKGLMITCKITHQLHAPVEDSEIESGAYEYTVDHRTTNNTLGMRPVWSGNVVFMKEDFLRAGQMDETYEGYGFEDHDISNTMESAGIKSVFEDEIELHLWHEKRTYGSDDQKQMFIDNGLYYCKKWDEEIPLWLKDEIRRHKGIGIL